MKGSNNFSDRTLSRIATTAAATVPGVAVVSSSWTEFGTRSYPRCEVRLDFRTQKVQLDFFLAVTFPAPITDVAVRVQANAETWIKAMTGLETDQINVTVEQTVLSDGRLTPADVNAAPAVPRLQQIQVRHGVTVRSPRQRGSVDVRSPQTAPSTPVRSPVTAPESEATVPDLPPLRRVQSPRVPSPQPLRPVTTTPSPLSASFSEDADRRSVPRVL